MRVLMSVGASAYLGGSYCYVLCGTAVSFSRGELLRLGGAEKFMIGSVLMSDGSGSNEFGIGGFQDVVHSGGDINSITGGIVDAAYQIHVNLGPGLLESVYETILARDLARRGFRVERQKMVSFDYEGLWFEDAFRVDLLIDSQVVVEVKSVTKPAETHAKQLLTYLKLLDCRVGLLINFGADRLKDGIKRVSNGAWPLRLSSSEAPRETE